MIEKAILNSNLNDVVDYHEYFHAFGYSEDDRVYLRTFSDRNKKSPGQNNDVRLADLASVMPWMKSAAGEGRGVFYVVNGDGQNDADVRHARAQFMEMDDFSFEEQINRINAFPLEPSIIVKTRKSLHCYWLLDAGERDRFRTVQERLIDVFNGDPVIKNESRVMRLYGFYHMKEDPVMVTLLKFNPELRYTQDQLLHELGKCIRTSKKEADTAGEDVFQSTALSERQFYKGHREEGLMKMIARARNAGFESGTIRDMIPVWNYKLCVPPMTAAELDREIYPSLKRPFSSEYAPFHRIDKRGTPTAVIDKRIVQHLKEVIHMFRYGGIMYHYESGVYIPDSDGSYLKSEIEKLVWPDLVTAPTIDRIHKLFLIDHDLLVNSSDLNNYPERWINFMNGFYDPVRKELIPHDPQYRSLNQLPHIFEPEKCGPGDEIEKWLDHVAPDKNDREMLLQYCGYCMCRDIRQQKFLVLLGPGGSGKSTVLSMLEHVIGYDNISNVPLESLSVRFASYGLVGKLLNSCADLKVGILEDTSTIKQLLGEDSIRAEPKGKDAFSFKSYARLIFSTNEIPLVVNERTNGFYRRLLILRVDQIPKVVRADYQEALQREMDYFIKLCVEALGRMYEKGSLTISKNSEESVKNLYRDSDSVQAWIEENCTVRPEGKTLRTNLRDSYESFCNYADRTALSPHNFYRALKSKGFREVKNQGEYYFRGLSLGRNIPSPPSMQSTDSGESQEGAK